MATTFTGRSKIKKEAGSKPDSVEESVAQAIYDLEQSANSELKHDLRDLHILKAQEVDVPGGKKAILITVPFPLLKRFRAIQARLIRELEKKFSGKHVVIVGFRRILPPDSKTNRVKRQKRPISRTLTYVHDRWLEDLVYPVEITGKRTRVRLDGRKLHKVFLDKKEQKDVEYKLDTFTAVYKRLTGKVVTFEFAPATLD